MSAHPPLKRLFIANRGEICRRIAISAQLLGVETCTLSLDKKPPLYLLSCINNFSYLDQRHVTSGNPYLDKDLLIEEAIKLGCDAIHPGFGFLSENAEFAQQCLESGLIWVGPKPESMKKMASKEEARRIAQQAKVPVNSGLDGIQVDANNLEEWANQVMLFAQEHGYPLLIKAAFGGGGKGMRLVYSQDQIKDALQRASSEAVNSFGNGLLIVEKYIEAPRHVEVQVIGDQQGHIACLGDRDCSIQRRHQKIIEEAPAFGLSDETRCKMHESAIRLAEAVHYQSLGTVEFLVDTQTKDQKFYFLEMNTRIQVEHPVTEMVTGLDLVQLQLFIAGQNKSLADLGIQGQQIGWTGQGHSIEARIYAEDPENNFLPSPGQILAFIPDKTSPSIRWEEGVDLVDHVDARYDPMIAKCVVHGVDRMDAIRRLDKTLGNTILLGPKNNIAFLRKILQNQSFQQKKIDTHFLERTRQELHQQLKEESNVALNNMLATWGVLRNKVLSGELHQLTENVPSVDGVTQKVFRRMQKVQAAFETQDYGIINRMVRQSYRDDAPTYCYWFRDQVHNVQLFLALYYHDQGIDCGLSLNGYAFYDKIYYNFDESAATGQVAGNDEDLITAPVPGKVVEVKINEGDEVVEDAVVMILESMKMEFEVKTSRQGKIARICVQAGDQVEAGQQLVVWQENTGD